MDINKIKTLAQLKKSGYISKTVKQELRDNLIQKIKNKEPRFEGIQGFDNTVIPDLERAILSGHNILLLGLRGQAKTKIARLTATLLDDYIPVVDGSEINDDPLAPISRFAKDIIAKNGDKTAISWLHKSERYIEKLATPDVSIADLIGDVDPIKAATLKLPYSDERIIHFGLITRAHRAIFALNELPDLQARIQVSLFNILQEEDLQIRGFKLRMPLDIQFIFTANPEDYTNRGSIITPLKDRIESQILTHYPVDTDIAKAITAQEANIHPEVAKSIYVPELLKDLLEIFVFKLRDSELIDDKSGVSARMSISAYENLVSTAERRMLLNKEKKTTVRINDFWGIIQAVTGKVELVYEGEQMGHHSVALQIMGQAFKEVFDEFFPNPDQYEDDIDPYGALKMWFNGGNVVDLNTSCNDKKYKEVINNIPGIAKHLKVAEVPESEKLVFAELLLHGLSSYNIISKTILDQSFTFSDPLNNMLGDFDEDDNLYSDN